MEFPTAQSSPFLLLWYIYLVFLAIVIIVNVLSKLIAAFFNWRIRRLQKDKS